MIRYILVDSDDSVVIDSACEIDKLIVGNVYGSTHWEIGIIEEDTPYGGGPYRKIAEVSIAKTSWYDGDFHWAACRVCLDLRDKTPDKPLIIRVGYAD